MNLHKFLALASRADRYFRHQRPDAVVLDRLSGLQLVDRAAGQGARHSGVLLTRRRRSGPGPAGGSRRCAASSITCCAACRSRPSGLPSAAATPRSWAIPFSTKSRRQQLDTAFIAEHATPDRPLVTILPGSRTQEVAHNLHVFLKRGGADSGPELPKVRFAIAAFKPHQAEMARAGRGRQRAADRRLRPPHARS